MPLTCYMSLPGMAPCLNRSNCVAPSALDTHEHFCLMRRRGHQTRTKRIPMSSLSFFTVSIALASENNSAGAS